jgi:hypothetical protein
LIGADCAVSHLLPCSCAMLLEKKILKLNGQEEDFKVKEGTALL